MLNKSLVVAKTNFRNIKLTYILTAVVIGCILIQDIVMLIIGAAGGIGYHTIEDNMTVSLGNYFFLLVILGAAFVPANFRKMMNLGGKRADFFNGCALTYAIMAAGVSLVCVVLYLTYDRAMVSALYRGGTLDVLYWFGWIDNGALIAFFQLFAFLLLFAAFVHTLVAAQDKWYGWAADILIVAIISVFVPIAPLRSALLWFFDIVIFNPNAFVQIAACLILAVAIYSLNKFILARKAI
ncbi:MAG: hypothetical protein FWH48_08070 [Oscillospiraceae bacterium]|nr:hypothetical protein [Oscillospiraceae bacterium]